MEFVIVTGLSGAGKSKAIYAMEDMDFYCVDNIPPSLIPVFYDLCNKSANSRLKRVAIVTDVRVGDIFDEFIDEINKIKEQNIEYKLLFLDAENEVLLRRFKETRRKHPLCQNNITSIESAIVMEREILKPLKEIADYIIDTTHISPAQLKERLSDLFLEDSSSALNITCMSFGFKYGTPADADIQFDVRCLPNPYYIDELKHFTGLDDNVKDYVMKWEQTIGFKERMISLIDYMIPLYCDEGKSQLVIAIGCTGGKHRSVALTQFLYNHLTERGCKATVHHRDIRK